MPLGGWGPIPIIRSVCSSTWMDEQGKATMVGLMMARKHQAGLRGKAATSFIAGIQLKFASAALSTSFLDEAVVATARAACAMKLEELRAKRDDETASTV